MFAASGYELASMREIATLAGVTPAAIYLYFKDKRSLYLAACRHCFARSTQRILDAASQGGTPIEQLSALVHGIAGTLIEDADATRLFERELITSGAGTLAETGGDAFLKGFERAVDVLAAATGKPPSVEGATSLFALTLGLIQFSQLLETSGDVRLGFNRDARKLADYVLDMAVPGWRGA